MYDDTLTYTANINSQSTWLSFNSPTLTFSGIPTNVSDIGITTITVTATDLNDGSVNNSFTVTVDNRIPTVNEGLASTSVFVGDQFSYEIPENAFSDGDIMYDDTLTYTANINPQNNWLTFSSKTRTFSGIPTNVSDIGITTITVTATDLNDGSVNNSFTVTVDNRIPTIDTGLKDQEAFVGVGFSYEIPENAFSDPDGGTLSYSTDENLGWLDFNIDTFSGTPSTVTDIGISTITVTVTDLNDGSVSSSFTLTVPNRLPIQTTVTDLTTQVAVIGKGFSYEILETAFIDPDGGSLSYAYTPDENLGWLGFDTPTLTFSGTPPGDTSTGINTVFFTVTDLNGGSVNSHFILNIVTVQ